MNYQALFLLFFHGMTSPDFFPFSKVYVFEGYSRHTIVNINASGSVKNQRYVLFEY